MENSNSNKVLVLRTCAADMSAYGGFIWPKSGFVEAHDWNPKAECGNGLHGLLWGQGSSGYLSVAEDANWMVCEVEKDKIVDLEDKVKFPSCEVVFCGEKEGAINYLMENGGRGYAIVYSTLTGGDRSTLTGGYGSTLTGGENATLIVKLWNGKRYKMHIAYVGEDGIKEGVKYLLNDDNEFVEVKNE
ncbi:hypothetical protein [Citrobacter farmeri]|uniref:DUF7666 domain-containing protein n=1 Tax=Citrobacter farmeri TaxID=67824 RepID=UPI002A826B77|nr:hypothetical protein [Citrobacter farmeri]